MPNTALSLFIFKASDIQERILKRIRVEQPELIPLQKQVALTICTQYAEFYKMEKKYDEAAKYYVEALAFVPYDTTVSLISNLHTQTHNKGNSVRFRQKVGYSPPMGHCLVLIRSVEPLWCSG